MDVILSQKEREKEIATAESVPIMMHKMKFNVKIEYISLVAKGHSVKSTFPDMAKVVKREQSSSIAKANDSQMQWVMRLE